MNLELARTATETRERLVRQRPRWVLAWVALAAMAETLGRGSEHDALDVIWLLAFTLLGVATNAAHHRQPIPWWGAIRARLAGWRDALVDGMPQSGIDLRLEPPLPDAIPGRLRRVTLGFWVVASLALLALPWLPHGPRLLAAHGGYVLYLAWSAVVWSLCMLVSIWSLTMTIAAVRDFVYRARSDTPDPPRKAARRVSQAVLMLGLLLAFTLPAWVPLVTATVLTVVAVAALHLPRVGQLRFAWHDDESRTFRSCRWSAIASLISLCGLAVLVTLASTTLGVGLVGVTDHAAAHPMARTLGGFVSWVGGAVLCGGAIRTLRYVWLSCFRDPAGRHPPRAHVGGRPSAEEREAIRTSLAALGWQVAFGADPRLRTDVPVALSTLVWAVRGAQPTEDQVIALERRHAVRQRRIVRRGLRRLLRAAARHKNAAGTGWWINPHLWHATRLKRDLADDGEGGERPDIGLLAQYVGPAYADIFPLPVRRHLLEVFRACDVDLLFAEDGVSARRLLRVLGVLFELHDIHRGGRRAEERDFALVGGTRVCIHDVRLRDPYRVSGYPEPDYDHIGRARVLHVFRDRGGDTVRDETPAPGERVPLLA